MISIQQKGYFTSIAEFFIFHHKVLGTGSFGVVKLACHIHTSKLYAIKIIDLDLAKKQPDLIAVVTRQNIIHSRLEHPHVVKLWDSIFEQGKLYMIMEYLPMGSLFNYQNNAKTFSEPQAFKFFYQSLQALKFLHSQNIIHRDLKPQNLLLDSELNIKLCDFGWATYFSSSNRKTFCGTYQYMAPQIVFQKNYDQRVDIWALGILLYEMLHGHAPYLAQSLEDLKIRMNIHNIHYDVSQSISVQCQDLISNILKFDHKQRFGFKQIQSHAWVLRMQMYLKLNLEQENILKGNDTQNRIKKREKISISQKNLVGSPHQSIQHYRNNLKLVKNGFSPSLSISRGRYCNTSSNKVISYKEIGNISTNNTISTKKLLTKGPCFVMNSPSSKKMKIKNGLTPQITVFQPKNNIKEFQASENETKKKRGSENENIFYCSNRVDQVWNSKKDQINSGVLTKKKKNRARKHNSMNMLRRTGIQINQFQIKAKKTSGNSNQKSNQRQLQGSKQKSKQRQKSKSKSRQKWKNVRKQKMESMRILKNGYKADSPIISTPTYRTKKQKIL